MFLPGLGQADRLAPLTSLDKIPNLYHHCTSIFEQVNIAGEKENPVRKCSAALAMVANQAAGLGKLLNLFGKMFSHFVFCILLLWILKR